MQKVMVSSKSVQWPHRCAVCGSPPTGTASSTCAVVTDARYFGIFVRTKHRYTTVTYPVCRRHKLIADLTGFIAARNLINLTIGVAWAFMVFGFFANLYGLIVGMSVTFNTLFVYGCLALLGIAIFEFGRRLIPVKLANATDNAITLVFRSKAYAVFFMNVNKNIIKHPSQ